MTVYKQPPVYSRPSYAIGFIPCNTQSGVFLGSAAFDASVRLNVVLGAEVWAAKRRQNVVDSLMAKNIMPTSARVEAYVPTDEETKLWASQRDQMIKDKLGPLIEMAKVSPSFPAPTDAPV